MTKHSKYAKLDAAIVKAIAAGATPTFYRILARVKQLCAPHETKDSPAWRVLDRRLQALRKAGKIRFNRSAAMWGIAKPADNASA